jgi:hypothetical protein
LLAGSDCTIRRFARFGGGHEAPANASGARLAGPDACFLKGKLARALPESAFPAREPPRPNGRESTPFAGTVASAGARPNAAELHGAIAAINRALATADGRDQVLELVRERAALRSELKAMEAGAGESNCTNASRSVLVFRWVILSCGF